MLHLSGVSKTYPGAVRALHQIDLEVPSGLFGLLGPNGAGKSTLMRTIATLQRPDEGSVAFDGIDALQDPLALRQVLGYLPQEFGVYPRTSAEAMLRHIAALKGIHGERRRTEVEALLVRTRLWEVRGRAVDTFSGGMKQRFGIAQALLGSPRLLIVDEPTAGLDPAERRRFHNLLAEVGERTVVLLSTHIVDDVADLCPRLAILGEGRILVQGEARELIRALEGRVWTGVPSAREGATSKRGRILLSHRLRAGRLEGRFLAEACPGAGMVPAEPTLEDAYFAALLQKGLTDHLD